MNHPFAAQVGTLADDDFTSDVRGLVGPMVSMTLRDEAMKETITSTIKDYTLDMVHDAEFTAELSAIFEKALVDANSTFRKALLAGANKALNPFAGGPNGAAVGSPVRAGAKRASALLQAGVDRAFRKDELVEFSMEGLATDDPTAPRHDFDITPDPTPASTPAGKGPRLSSPKTF